MSSELTEKTDDIKPTGNNSKKTIGKVVVIMLLVVLAAVIAKQEVDMLLLKRKYDKLEQDFFAENTSTGKLFTKIEETVKEIYEKQEQALDKFNVLKDTLSSLAQSVDAPDKIWVLSESLFLVHIAHERLILSKDIRTAIILLQTADSDIARLRLPELSPIRKVLQENIAILKAIQWPDIDGIWYKIGTIIKMVDEIPIDAIVTQYTDSKDDVEPKISSSSQWSDALYRTWRELKGLIIIRRQDNFPTLTHSEKIYILQNLKMQLEMSRWAAIQRQEKMYADSLSSARAWLRRFVTGNTQSLEIIDNSIVDLESIEVDPKIPDLKNSMDVIKDAINVYKAKLLVNNLQKQQEL